MSSWIIVLFVATTDGRVALRVNEPSFKTKAECSKVQREKYPNTLTKRQQYKCVRDPRV